MGIHTEALWSIARDLLDAKDAEHLKTLATSRPLDFDGLVEFDASLGWASMTMVSVSAGNFHHADRDVLRPLQYVATYIRKMCEGSDAEWLTRETVHMASLHLEGLVKRIGLTRRLPLGRAMRAKVFREKVDERKWQQLDRFRAVCNAAKHDMTHPVNTHMFSEEDAVVAYIVCRVLGNRLHPMARLKTHWGETTDYPPDTAKGDFDGMPPKPNETHRRGTGDA